MQRIKKQIALCFVLVICALLRAQESPNELDSVKARLTQLPGDTASVSLILKEANKYYGVDYVVFLEILNIGEPKALQSKNPGLLGYVLYLKGCAYLNLSDFAKASEYLTLSKIIAERTGNKKLFITSVAELGNVHELNGNLDQAMEYYRQGLKVANTHKDPRFKGMILNKIGGIHYRRGELKTTIALLKESAKLFNESKDTMNMILLINNTSLLFFLDGQLDSAEFYLDQSEKIITNYNYRRPDILMSYYTIRGKLDLAGKNYRKSLESFGLGLKLANDMSMPGGIYDSYKNMSLAYEGLGNYKEALEYHKLYYMMVDSLVSRENFEKALQIQNQYEAEKKENELLRANTENEIKQVELQRMGERKSELINYIILLIAIIVLFIFFLVVLVLHISSRRKAYQLLTEKNVQIESQSKELSQSAKLIAKFQFQMNPHFVFNALHNIQGLIIAQENSKATEQIQRLATLMRKTFNNAEKDYITVEEELLYLNTYFSFESNTSFQKIQFSTEVPKGLEEALIPPMMIQPFIENSIKHAQLNTVTNPFIKVNIASEDDFLCITIHDNGKGMTMSKTGLESTADSSHSMNIIKSRIELLFQGIFFPAEKKAFSVKTVPEVESGTLVRFYLPLQYLY